jgi:drug/metabolite transporter (DMT)-like permease
MLLAPRSGEPPLGWSDLVAVRYVPTAVCAAAWCAVARGRESLEVVRAHPVRLLLSAFFCVPAYNGLMYLGMARRVEGPLASLLTSLIPLYLLAIGRLFLGEPLTRRKTAGLGLGLAGVGILAAARGGEGTARAVPVLLAAAAPLAWAIHSAITRPVTRDRSPLLWTMLVLVAGGVLILPFLPFVDGSRVAALDGTGLLLIAYLVVPATLAGFAVWSWLLRQLPAGTVGLTTFLNPPMTLGWKVGLSALFPASFALSVLPLEWVGGGVALSGVALAVLARGEGTGRERVGNSGHGARGG